MSVYIDVSNLMEINFLTGIQRVVREVVIRLLKNETLDVRLISFSNGKFQIVSNEDFLRCYDDNLISQKLISKNNAIDFEEFSKDDLLFDIDSVWNAPYKRTELYPFLKRNGVKIVTYVHDIIPIEHPEFATTNVLCNFMGYIAAVLEYSDLVMVSTQSTLDKINILTDKLRSKRVNGFVTCLGSDFKIKSGRKEEISDIEKYLSNPDEYAKRKEIEKKFKPTTWDEVTERMEKYILTLRNDKKLPIPAVKQIIFLSARIDDLLSTLPFIEKYMLFIKELVVICPDKMAVELKSKYNGRFTLTTLPDGEVLNGNPLPEDHQARNFYLRCLAIQNKKIDDVFIMTDDDYRPLKNIEISTFIENGKYNAYFCHNLDEWQAPVWHID